MIEVWRGSINTWECDEMGHLNVRHYVGKAWEGLAGLAPEIGLPNAFRDHQAGTVRPVLQHIRFVREIRPGEPIFMRAGVLSSDETGADIYQEIVHEGSGALAASLRTRLAHVERYTGKPFAWSPSTRAALQACAAAPDPTGAPRTLSFPGDHLENREISLERLGELGARCIGRGVFQSAECAQHGVVRPASFFGRISDSVPNLMAKWRAETAREAGISNQGAAVLEARLVYRGWPGPGDRWQLYTGLGGANGKTHRLVHWMIDPDTGRPWLSAEAIAVTFDLDTRKAIAPSEKALAILETLAPKGLRP